MELETFYCEATNDIYLTPEVSLNPETGECWLKGESYIENTIAFYAPIFAWLKEYTKDTTRPLSFTFHLKYFNTSSSKAILKIMQALKYFQDAGGKLNVVWYYPKDDEDLQEEGEDYGTFLGLNLKVLPAP
jgi:hypothetical protein